MNLNMFAAYCSAISILFISVIHWRTAVFSSDGFTRKGLILSFLTNEGMHYLLIPLECLHNATQGAL